MYMCVWVRYCVHHNPVIPHTPTHVCTHRMIVHSLSLSIFTSMYSTCTLCYYYSCHYYNVYITLTVTILRSFPYLMSCQCFKSFAAMVSLSLSLSLSLVHIFTNLSQCTTCCWFPSSYGLHFTSGDLWPWLAVLGRSSWQRQADSSCQRPWQCKLQAAEVPCCYSRLYYCSEAVVSWMCRSI